MAFCDFKVAIMSEQETKLSEELGYIAVIIWFTFQQCWFLCYILFESNSGIRSHFPGYFYPTCHTQIHQDQFCSLSSSASHFHNNYTVFQMCIRLIQASLTVFDSVSYCNRPICNDSLSGTSWERTRPLTLPPLTSYCTSFPSACTTTSTLTSFVCHFYIG